MCCIAYLTSPNEVYRFLQFDLVSPYHRHDYRSTICHPDIILETSIFHPFRRDWAESTISTLRSTQRQEEELTTRPLLDKSVGSEISL
jgi:hypothetical protein